MSWLKSAVHKAVEVGNKRNANLSRFRSVADTVLIQAVTGGAKLLQDRIENRNMQSFRHAVKRLEEVSVSCRGEERILLLRRWLVSFKQVDRMKIGLLINDREKVSDQDDEGSESRQPISVTYYDSDHGGQLLNFHDAFLHSQALEGIILSMILEAPNDEEISLVLEIFRLSLLGRKDVHQTIISNIQDLAKVFSSYHDEVLMKREELLQYAQVAIRGLKMNADVARIDVEVSTLKKKLSRTESQLTYGDGGEKLLQGNSEATIEELKEALSKIQIYSKLETLLLEKKAIRNGDSPEAHAQKIDKLKILLQSLANSTSKAERRILDHRSHKEEALHFRLAKATEVSQVEKELVAEIEALEKQKDELEVQLKKVNTSLAAAKTHLRNAREERDQFDDASNEILQHLQMKEEELSRSIASFKVEAGVISTWIKFIDDTWGVQSAFGKQKEKQARDELESNEKCQTNLIMHLLPTYENELENSVTRFRVLVRRLKSSEELDKVAHVDDEAILIAATRKCLEEEYQDLETKLTTAFSLLENIKQAWKQSEDFPREDKKQVKDLFDALERIKDDFESLERPSLRVEKPKQQLSWPVKPLKLSTTETNEKQGSVLHDKYSKGPVIDGWNLLESEEATPESESAKLSKAHLAEEIIDWEFDAVDY